MDVQVNYDYRGSELEQLLDIEQLACLVLAEEGARDTSEVAITFVDNDQIHQLNAAYRGIDAPTDVLSFECDGCEQEDFLTARLDDMPFELGDIFIAVDVAEAQAPGFGLSLAEEISLLITHGLLHLLGYDHMKEDEALQMEARETELLSQFWGAPFKRSRVED